MMEVDLDLLLQYPLIKKQPTKDGMTYTGIVEVKGEDCNIQLQRRKRKFSFNNLGSFNKHKGNINKILLEKNCSSEYEAFNILKSIIEPTLINKVDYNCCEIYQRVIHEYAEFTKFYLNLKSASLSPDLSKIFISVSDEEQREHSIQVAVDKHECKDIFKIEIHDLPLHHDNKNLFKSNSSLLALFDQFLGVIDVLQPYFHFMDYLDKNSWILDPLVPMKKDCYRRINLGDNTTVTIIVDPYDIKLRPNLKFLGPERYVDIYRNKLNENLDKWDVKEDPQHQVLELLGIDSYPQKPFNERQAVQLLKDDGECSICFAFQLNGKIPEIVCQNECCANCYHMSCLYEWLISVNAQRIFNDIVGACPNCEKQISCPIY